MGVYTQIRAKLINMLPAWLDELQAFDSGHLAQWNSEAQDSWDPGSAKQWLPWLLLCRPPVKNHWAGIAAEIAVVIVIIYI